MNKKWIMIGATVIVIAGTTAWLRSGPEPSQFAYVARPRISHMDDQRVLVVAAAGDPNVVAGRGFRLLFSAYYKLNGVSKIRKPPAPRARWSTPGDTPKSEWTGKYAVPVDEEVTSVPAESDGDLQVRLATWGYGDVAEILHVGPYSNEEADITRLLTFIASSGYRVVGEHEEEYIRGPGMFFAGDPQKYLTIIRLRVAPAVAAPTLDE